MQWEHKEKREGSEDDGLPAMAMKLMIELPCLLARPLGRLTCYGLDEDGKNARMEQRSNSQQPKIRGKTKVVSSLTSLPNL